MPFKVLTRTPLNDRYPYRTHSEHDTMEKALAVAVRLEKNTELEVLVELPNNAIKKVPLRLLELTA